MPHHAADAGAPLRSPEPVTARLAEFIAGTPARALPSDLAERATLHLLDTVAAMVSGTTLAAGRQAAHYLGREAAPGPCSVPGTALAADPCAAALANGMAAHADETDDSHGDALIHPGCAIVPAALAMAEREGRSGADLLAAVVAGYETGIRMSLAMGGFRMADTYHMAPQAWGGTFGATAAAAALARLDAQGSAAALSYAVQSASGNRAWIRDPDHVQKAFVFGGMPASAGVRAVLMAQAGFTGVADAIEGVPGLLASFRETSDAACVIDDLGSRYEMAGATLKKWSVGMPVQAALDSLEEATLRHGLTAAQIARIDVTLPAQRVQVVDSAMPSINLPHLLALYLADGGLTFASIHDPARMADPAVARIARRIAVAPRPGAGRRDLAHLTVHATDGRSFAFAPDCVRGQPQNPMTSAEVAAKALDLVQPVLGPDRGAGLVARLLAVRDVADMGELSALWRP